jgi:hypothetical protein
MVMPPRSFNSALADGDALFDGQIIAVGQVNAVVDFDPGADAGEEVAAQHTAEAHAQPVVGTDGRTVEHLPEPEQRLALGELLGIGVGKVLGLQGHVFRVQREREHVAGQLRGERQVELAAVRAAQVELVELVAHNLGAAFRCLVAGELVIEKLDPAAVDLFGLKRGMGCLVRIIRHTLCTIHHQGWVDRVLACAVDGPPTLSSHPAGCPAARKARIFQIRKTHPERAVRFALASWPEAF